jgi:hypothetical protein
VSARATPTPDFVLRRVDGGNAYVVEVDGATAGIVRRRPTLLSNLGKTKQATSAHGRLWYASPDGASLDDYDHRAVRRHLGRTKRTRHGAARYLLQAYNAADIPLPAPPGDNAAAA